MIALVAAAALVRLAPELAPPAPPADAEILVDGHEHWARHGFVAIQPPIRLPIDAARRAVVRIELFVPPGGRIDVRRDRDRARLVWPAGTIADRVELWRERGHLHVADVRGTELGPEGTQRFRVFRPAGAHLFGARWARGDLVEARRARTMFEAAMGSGVGFSTSEAGARSEHRAASTARFSRLLDCAACHAPARAEVPSSVVDTELPRRGTDDAGFHVFAYALEDRAPLETYRPVDPNAEDRFVSYECGAARSAPTHGTRGRTDLRCADGSIPELAYDLEGALAAREPHALEVCRGRAFLAARMTPRAREVFGPRLGTCGLAEAFDAHGIVENTKSRGEP